MGAAVCLLVETDDVDDPQRVDLARDQVGRGADQGRVGVGEFTTEELHGDLASGLDLFVDPGLDALTEFGRHVLEREVEPAGADVHVAAGDRDLELLPDHAAQDVQRGVRTHHQVAARPVERVASTVAPAAGSSSLAIDPVPDPARVTLDPYDVGCAFGERDRPGVVRLTATTGEECGARQQQPPLL